MTMDLQALCKKAVDLLRSYPTSTRIRVVSHYDADGIAAAGVLCTSLLQQGFDFHATLMRNPFTKGFDRLKAEKNELIIFSDMGSGQLETIKNIGCPVIILDHHQSISSDVPDNIIEINAHLCGFDGNYEASGATLSYAFAVALDSDNERLAPLALAGATGDKQYLGGFRGYNKEVLDTAIKKGFLSEIIGLKLSNGSLSDALYYAIDPFYKELSGNSTAVRESLNQLQIDGKKTFQELSDDEKRKVQSYLVFMLIKTGCHPFIVNEVVRKRYWSNTFGYELERFADLLDACGKNGYRSLGLALCLNGSTVIPEAEKVERVYQQKILDELLVLNQQGAQEMSCLRYFFSNDSSLGGVVGGIAMNYVFDEKKPLFSLARKNNEIHVSCRGNQMLVQQGLDLGYAMKTVAEGLGGYGGGHKIAAGATISTKHETKFLEQTNELICTQLKKGSV